MAMPDVRDSWKMNRPSPVTLLSPIQASSRPSAPPKRPLSMAPEERPAMTVMPKTVVQKSSDGPNFMANSDMGGVRKIRASAPTTPPIRDEKKVV